MNPEPSEAANAFYGQVLTGLRTLMEQQSHVQSAMEQQSQLRPAMEQQTHALHALETRLSTGTSQKRTDVPWPTFAAESKENVRHWIHQMEFAFLAHLTPDDRKVVHAALCLKGEALSWLIGQTKERGQTPFGDWNDLARSILERFEPVHLQHQLRDQLREIKQTTTVREYVGRFRSLLNQVDTMAEEDKVAYFVTGLKPDLRYEIRRQRPVTLAATITLAEDTHAALFADCSPSASVRSVASSYPQPKAEPTAMEIDALEFRGRNTSSQRPLRCFNCRGLGHLSRDCPSPRRTNEQGSPLQSKTTWRAVSCRSLYPYWPEKCNFIGVRSKLYE
jgi:Retrotransposon gag protein/Zinc knuckle